MSIVSQALFILGKASRPWSCVRGPGAAFVASAQRLGWNVVSAFECVDDRGHCISFVRDSPAMVRLLTEDSVRRWRWRRIEARYPQLQDDGSGRGLVIAPLWKFLNQNTTMQRGGRPNAAR